MNKEKKERIYRVIMLVVLTATITFIITTITMYNKIGSTSVKYISTTDNVGKTFKTFYNFT